MEELGAWHGEMKAAEDNPCSFKEMPVRVMISDLWLGYVSVNEDILASPITLYRSTGVQY